MSRGRTTHIKRLLAALVAVVLVVGFGAARADAHAELLSTAPADGAVLDAGPAKIALTFSESVEVALGGIKLLDANAKPVKIGPTQHGDGNASIVEATVPALTNGTYVVSWRAISSDSHPVFGAFTFRVGQGAIGDTNALRAQALAGGGASKAVGAGLGITRLATFASLATLIGLALFASLLTPIGSERRVRRLLWVAITVAVIAAFAGIGFQGAYASGGALGQAADASLWRAVAKTRFGTAALLRVALLCIASALVVQFAHRHLSLWRVAAGANAIGLLVSVAMAGHATTGLHPAVGMAADLVHLGAVSVWLGGLVGLAIVLASPPRARAIGAAVNANASTDAPIGTNVDTVDGAVADIDDESMDASEPSRHELTMRFSRIALGSVAALVASGAVQSWRQVGSLAGLWTGYGHLLLWKLAAVAGVLALAVTSRRTVRRWRASGGPGGLRRNVTGELAVGLVVLAITAALVAAQPGRESISGPVTVNLVATDTQATLTIDPARHGTAAFHLYFAPPGGSLQKVKSASLQLTLESQGVGPLEIKLDAAGSNHYTTEAGFIPLPGRWTVQITALLTDFDERQFTTTVNVT